jgi:hypothetical protein
MNNSAFTQMCQLRVFDEIWANFGKALAAYVIAR